ncbi:hypothetical protein NOJ05_28960 [Neorhizobium galegae]|uniref:hypothetical protein n=1 Tax=Neorhizobium galegae TaxID=399 RepID=UPI0006276C34|nr:hypothetical protein [Neorhizobium galegae]KAA9382317.1 hypothetical protein F4V88_29725 [Neorhizobium galegae]KAB1108827.1 hypothetical protein F4V89_28735 [Neorhizobium galegae]MCQ1769638.1 hypothetical protein [Neorhizobium galegae]MCQ1775285.1 hypothetical protein [Neorhizobium galegae]MCQ1781247.1 hypothetical protein [Neorhizobium galegae]
MNREHFRVACNEKRTRISDARRADLKAHEATAAKRNAFSHGAVIASVGVGGAADIVRAATEARAAQKNLG